MSQPLRLQPSVAVKEKRLTALLEGRGLPPDDPGLAAIVEDAQLLGSLELAGLRVTWDAVRSSRVADEGPAEVLALRRARAAVPAGAPFSLGAIRAWHEALAGPVGLRRGRREREGAPPPPPELVEGRLATLAEWLAVAGPRDLAPDQVAAVALARLVEILPFDDANGRVSRLAASHLMVRGGMRPPILVAGDAPRLRAALEAAFRLETETLVALLAEASGRALDVMIQTLSGRESKAGPP
jgi:Fic family protein